MIGREAVMAALRALNELECPYMVTGALATSAPQMTLTGWMSKLSLIDCHPTSGWILR